MSATLVESAARRHRLEEWIDTNRLPGELHVRHWLPDRVAIAGLVPQRQRRLPGGLGTTSGIWTVGADPDGLVRIDVREQRGLVEAHRALPRVLAQMQAPVVGREPDADVGDVLFGAQGGRVLVFARGNLLVVVASVGRRPVDIVAVARALDRSVVRPRGAAAAVSADEAPTGESADEMPTLQVERQAGRVRRVDLWIPAWLRVGGQPMITVRAPRGRLFEEGSTLLYEPAEEQPRGELEVAVRSRGGAGELVLRGTP